MTSGRREINMVLLVWSRCSGQFAIDISSAMDAHADGYESKENREKFLGILAEQDKSEMKMLSDKRKSARQK